MSGCTLRTTRAAAMLMLASITGSATAALQGSEWKPVLIDDVAVPGDTSAFIQFHSKGRLVGFSGCNSLAAEYETDQGFIFIGPVAATRMACADSVMAREASLATALENARHYQRTDARLVLFDSAGRPILELRQTDWD